MLTEQLKQTTAESSKKDPESENKYRLELYTLFLVSDIMAALNYDLTGQMIEATHEEIVSFEQKREVIDETIKEMQTCPEGTFPWNASIRQYRRERTKALEHIGKRITTGTSHRYKEEIAGFNHIYKNFNLQTPLNEALVMASLFVSNWDSLKQASNFQETKPLQQNTENNQEAA